MAQKSKSKNFFKKTIDNAYNIGYDSHVASELHPFASIGLYIEVIRDFIRCTGIFLFKMNDKR
jgi:hypothetical protein